MGAAIGMGGAEIAFAAEGLAESGEDMNVFTSFDGVRIAYHDEGEGPAVVLLHGYGLDGLSNFGDVGRSLPMLERMSELCRAELGVAPPLPAPAREGRPGLIPVLLAAGSRVIVPDMRGSAPPTSPVTRPPTPMPPWPAMSSP
jgi:pimeloyl-ACP methyl ester carboxylesterase